MFSSEHRQTANLIVGRAFRANPAKQRRLLPAPALPGRYVFALRPLVPVRVRAEPEAAVPRTGCQLAKARLTTPAARLDGRELQRRGPQRRLVAAGQENLQHLCVIHPLHRFVVDVCDEIAWAEARLECRTPRVHGLCVDRKKKRKRLRRLLQHVNDGGRNKRKRGPLTPRTQ